MTLHDDEVRLRHMLDRAREAVALIRGRERTNLEEDRILELGLTRLVEIIGEAASRIQPETRSRHFHIPWSRVIGMRHRLIHGYDNIDRRILWDTLVIDLPPLIAQLEAILERQS